MLTAPGWVFWATGDQNGGNSSVKGNERCGHTMSCLFSQLKGIRWDEQNLHGAHLKDDFGLCPCRSVARAPWKLGFTSSYVWSYCGTCCPPKLVQGLQLGVSRTAPPLVTDTNHLLVVGWVLKERMHKQADLNANVDLGAWSNIDGDLSRW